jgi:LPS-assembly protein
VTQDIVGHVYHLRGKALVETTDMRLEADELDYNDETGDAEARGHVVFENFARGEKLRCDKAEYNTDELTGKFYNVSGSAASRIQARPGLLTTTNPFYFEGKWAERMGDKYILHDGFLTDCIVPRPWWRLKGKKFDIIPGKRAITRGSWFYLRGLPLFYTPFFYKALEKEPRRSGFLSPNIGNSSQRGRMVGVGYFWAINRSYDLTYLGQYYSERGLAHHVDFRGKINDRTDFNFSLFGIRDGTLNGVPEAGGVQINLDGKSILGKGWEAHGELNYLSNFAFRQQFTESFHEAVFSETHSVGFLTKHWSDFGVNVVAQRDVNFQSTAPGDQIVTRKLPEVEFLTREHALWNLLYVSLDSSEGLERRSQPLYQTRQFVSRLDFAPHVSLPLHFWGLGLLTTYGIRETYYDSGFQNGVVTGENVLRNSRDLTLDLMLPSLARVFAPPKWLSFMGIEEGSKVKHVIEPRITYRDVSGIDNFQKLIRFDESELLTNTNEVEFSLTNRLLAKSKDGQVTDFVSWQLWYKRYFDPTFGGAIIPGRRNVIESGADLTGFSFFDGYRHSSPIVSAFRIQSKLGFEWRTDYDPVQHHFVNSSFTLDGRYKKYAVSGGHTIVRTNPILSPRSDQLRGSVIYGNSNSKGWNVGFAAYYDYRLSILQYSQAQITYNTDCCGFSVQYRRFSLIGRNDNQFRVAYAISNIGTVGTLKRQEKIF